MTSCWKLATTDKAKFLLDTGCTNSLIKKRVCRSENAQYLESSLRLRTEMDPRSESEIAVSTPDVKVVTTVNIIPANLNLQ